MAKHVLWCDHAPETVEDQFGGLHKLCSVCKNEWPCATWTAYALEVAKRQAAAEEKAAKKFERPKIGGMYVN